MSTASDMAAAYGLSEAFHERFLKAMSEVYAAYLKHGARSTKKLVPLHGWVIEEMKQTGLGRLQVRGYGDQVTEKEVGLAGFYYKKNLDVAIQTTSGRILGVVSSKCIMKDFNKNANNYFESLIGEVANLRKDKLVFGTLILRMHDRRTEINGKKNPLDPIRDSDIVKYNKLLRDHMFIHVPNAIGIGLIDVDGTRVSGLTDPLDVGISKKNQELLRTSFNLEGFFNTMKLLLQLNSTYDQH